MLTHPLLMTDMTDKEVLPSAMEKVFGSMPCLFPINLCLAQLQAHANDTDIIAMAATGLGKHCASLCLCYSIMGS